MGSVWVALLVFLVVNIHSSHSIKGGTTTLPCDYDGMAAVTIASNIYCNGVISGSQLIVPESCNTNLALFTNFIDITVNYADGSETTNIPQGTYSATIADGIATVDLTGFSPSGCFQEATLYDKATHTLDLATCKMVSYGGATNSDFLFDQTLEEISLTKVASVECCSTIDNEALSTEYAQIPTSGVPLNCVASTGAACGVADLGAPIYCSTTDGTLVVTGLTASYACVDGETTLVADLSGADPNFKFGY